MKNIATSRDYQRNDFVKNLYSSLRIKTQETLKASNKFASRANAYLQDGLEPEECVELLILDGLNREASVRYVEMAQEQHRDYLQDSDATEYGFTFEDSTGRIWSSNDIKKVVTATSDEEAWDKVEDLLNSDDRYELEKVLSIERYDR